MAGPQSPRLDPELASRMLEPKPKTEGSSKSECEGQRVRTSDYWHWDGVRYVKLTGQSEPTNAPYLRSPTTEPDPQRPGKTANCPEVPPKAGADRP